MALQKIAEKVAENFPAAIGVGTAGGTTSGILTAFQGWIGIGLAVATFAVNWWYKRRRDKREQELHENGSSKNKG